MTEDEWIETLQPDYCPPTSRPAALALAPCSPLFDPPRKRVEKLADVARARLDALPEQWKCSMGYDAAITALDEMSGCGVVARSIRKEARDAIKGRDGWDTWEPRERDNAILLLCYLADAFDALSRELQSLHTAETVEIERLRAKREANG